MTPTYFGLAGLLVLGFVLGFLARRLYARRASHSLEEKAAREFEKARAEAQKVILGAQEKAADILQEARNEERRRMQELRQSEERFIKKEDDLQHERHSLAEQAAHYEKSLGEVHTLEEAVRSTRDSALKELERVAHLSRDEAKSLLLKEIEGSHREELSHLLAQFERDRSNQLEARAIDLITSAIHRYARTSVADVTTSVVHIPNEELKGKIIGREGRNIRTFERLTGVEVVIDETPETLVLSSFDPLRRELAKMALEKLIQDGRIQPAKIEEKIEEAQKELDQRVYHVGEEAAYEVGVVDLPKEIISLLGKLNYRTSYGQNVLTHSVEMAHIAGMIAAELKLNVSVVKKAALLHDIGKAISHEVEGTHVELGRKLLKKYGVSDEVIHGMESHHEEYPFATPESYVVTAADAISAGRPGARRDTLEKYLKRLEDIEKTVNSFEGVKQSYAVSAGREVRVFVVPEKIDDFGALDLAKRVAQKIQSDVTYPGEIKVTVIREVKAVEYAR